MTSQSPVRILVIQGYPPLVMMVTPNSGDIVHDDVEVTIAANPVPGFDFAIDTVRVFANDTLAGDADLGLDGLYHLTWNTTPFANQTINLSLTV